MNSPTSMTLALLMGTTLLSAGARADTSTTRPVAEPVEMPTRVVLGRRAPAKIVLMSMKDRFSGEGLPEVEQRIKAELSNIGLEVVSIPARETAREGQMAELKGQAIASRALASVKVFRGSGHQVVQAWIYDTLTGKMTFRQLRLEQEKGPDAMASVALKVVELLHASLLEIRMPSQRQAARRAPPVVHKMVASKLDRPPPRRGPWSISGGMWQGWSLTEGGVGGGIALGLSWRPIRWLSLGAEGLAPLMSSQVGDHRGLARVTVLMFQGLGWVEPFSGSWASPGIGLGVGSLVVGAEGDAVAPNRGQTEWRAVCLLSWQARLAFRVSERVRILTTAGISITIPEVRVFFGADVISRLGRPMVSGTLAIEWNWGI